MFSNFRLITFKTSSGYIVIRTLIEWHSLHQILMMPTMEEALEEIQNPVKNPGQRYPLAYAKDYSCVKPRRAQTGYGRDLPATMFSKDLGPAIRQKKKELREIEHVEETHRSA